MVFFRARSQAEGSRDLHDGGVVEEGVHQVVHEGLSESPFRMRTERRECVVDEQKR